MTWEEFKRQKQESVRYVGYNEYIITNIECPECGALIYKNASMVLTCYPAQHNYRCFDCGWTGNA